MAANWGTRDAGSFIPIKHSAPYPAIDPTTTTFPQPFTVCIVGASRGIGAGIATAYAKSGVSNLILASRRLSGLETTRELCKSINPDIKIEIVETDITSAESVEALAKRVKDVFGGLDIVVVNSGYSGPVVLKLQNTDVKTFQEAIDVNYVGTFLCAKFLIPLLLSSSATAATGTPNRKSFIAVSSYAAFIVRGPIANAQYCVSKLAQLKLMEHIHEEYFTPSSPEIPSINSFSVHPGAVSTEMSQENSPSAFLPYLTESPDLCGAFCVWLTKEGRAWLSGRLVSALWDVEALEGRRGEIEEGDLLRIGLRM